MQKTSSSALLLTPEELASRWNITPAILSQWRWKGRGPRFIKLGRQVLYRLQDVEKFEEEQVRENTSQPCYGMLSKEREK